MRYFSVEEVASLHSLLIAQSGGSSGLRDTGALESAVAQPEASFGGQPLYPMISDKAAALGFSLIQTRMGGHDQSCPSWCRLLLPK